MLANSVSGQGQLTIGTLLIPPNILDNDETDNSNLLQMRLFFFFTNPQTRCPPRDLGIYFYRCRYIGCPTYLRSLRNLKNRKKELR